MQPIPIVYEEPHFLLANKPAGLFSQAPDGIDSLQARLIAQLKARDQHPGEPFVGLPHRLDRGTSGIMLIARNQRALKRFGQQFQSRKVIKHYLAVVEGVVAEAGADFSMENEEASSQERRRSVEPHCEADSQERRRSVEPHWEQRWEDYVRKIPDLPQAEIVTADAEGAKLAVALVECLRSVSAELAGQVTGESLLRIHLETGRMHQIRIQAASRGWPVVGDASYGAVLPWQHSYALPQSIASDPSHAHSTASQVVESPLADDAVAENLASENTPDEGVDTAMHGHPPIALHAWSLEFRHPQTAKPLRFVAPVPANWQQLPSELMECISRLA